MHPFAIIKFTPKSNCGQCGYPTCLAFAAAVAKTGEDASRCPFIAPGVMKDLQPEASRLDDLARQRDLALIRHLQTKIAALDFEAIAAPLGARWQSSTPDTLYLFYLGRAVEVSKKGIRLAGKEPEDPRDQILLYNYVSSAGGRTPDGTWVGMESLPNSISKIKTLSRYCEERLAPCLSVLNRKRLTDIAGRLAATMAPDSPSANLVLTVPVLPMLPERILFWEADPEDGFPARAKILFDHSVLDFLDLESLVFSAERLAERFITLVAEEENPDGAAS